MNWIISFIATIISAIILGSAIADENYFVMIISCAAVIANTFIMMILMGGIV
jgi:hypothetical protein